ncbi:MAG: outer membrane beta-barrel protein [Bacteroidia bacterium]
MKKGFYLGLFLIVNSLAAQEFRTSVMVGGGASWLNASGIGVGHSGIMSNGTNFSFSTAVREELILPKLLSFATEVNYSRMRASFSSPSYEFNIGTRYSYYYHTLNMHSIDVPVIIKVRTKREVSKAGYFLFSYGVSYIASTKRHVELYRGNMNSEKPDEILPVSEGEMNLKTSKNGRIGTLAMIGLGKNFLIQNKQFFCELRFRFDTNSWMYPVSDYTPFGSTASLKRQSLLLNLGYSF